MKQFIVELDKDISKESFFELAAWASKNNYWNIITDKTISIGQMIEFIKETNGECNIHSWQLIDPKDHWVITSHNEHAKELANALWLVVKKILEQ